MGVVPADGAAHGATILVAGAEIEVAELRGVEQVREISAVGLSQLLPLRLMLQRRPPAAHASR